MQVLFHYNFNDDVLKLQNANLKDIYDNEFKIEIAYLNTITNELIGKDIIINLDNKSFNKDNQPRIKGRSIEYNENSAELQKEFLQLVKRQMIVPHGNYQQKKFNMTQKKK